LRFLDAPGPVNILTTGFCAGLALLSKLTAALLPFVIITSLAVALLSNECRNGKHTRLRYVNGTLAALAIALLILNVGYGFDRTLLPLSTHEWKSGLFNTVKYSPFGKIPIPMPYLYLDVFDLQLQKKSGSLFVFFLNGELSRRGWASYYWIALLVKTPIPLLLGCAAALFGTFRKNASLSERLLWIPPAAFMGVFSLFVKMDMGIRYLLPIVPFLVVLAAGAMSRFASKRGWRTAAVVVLCLWYTSSIFRTFGNGLAYFNEFAGGPAGGHRYVLESNLDWGQNLIRLRNYFDEKQYHWAIYVDDYGLVPPQIYGINAFGIPCVPVRGTVAVSVNYLYGVGPIREPTKECYDWLKSYKPEKIIGNAIYVYNTRSSP
jgi:hypothetical protein